MNNKILQLTILLLMASIAGVILLHLTGCNAKLVEPVSDVVPYNLQVHKVAEGELKITWQYSLPLGDSLQFVISKRTGTGSWYSYYAVSGDYEFYDFTPTNDVYVYAYRVRAEHIYTYDLYPQSEIVAYFSEYADPGEVMVTQVSQDELFIEWIDNSIGEDGFYVDKKIDDGNWHNRYRTFGPNVSSFTDPTELYQEITYRVTAFTGVSTSLSVQYTYLTTLLSPTDLTLQHTDVNRIRLNWTDNSNGESGFLIDKKIGELEWLVSYAQVGSDITTYLDEIAEPCGDFRYRVRAFQDIYTSPYSEEAEIKIFLNETGSWLSGNPANDVFIDENTNWYAFLADQYNGLTVIDCVNPSVLEGVNYNEGGLPDRTYAVAVQNQIAYLTTHSGLNEHGRLYLVDVSTIIPFQPFDPPDALAIISWCPLDSSPQDTFVPYDIEVSGAFAYIADGANGLVVVDIDPFNTHVIADFQTGGTARNIYLDGNLAYIAAADGGLVVVDISDPYNPVLHDQYTTTGSTVDITIRDNHAFLADGGNGLKIINLTNSNVQYVPTGGFANSVYVQGQSRLQEDHVYLVDKEFGLYVIDISDLNNPYILGSYAMDSEPVAVEKFFQSSYVFVADNTGLKVIQVAP